ncbi:MAG TPA: trypsin-like peptidase domain-containing protein [Myxococcota bacterium]|nr:trypsin-like peptidase domain-containing protein [Myxococcota bacterium]
MSGPLPTGDDSLVPDDAPVYDRSLERLGLEDLDLEHFWHERPPHPREHIVIHSRTFADVAESVREGVVNIYTRRVEKRELRLGIHPNDLLPIRIPIASALLDVIPFQVPVPFQAEGLSLGSGFVLNEGGFILTNAHVVQNATDIRIVFSGSRREYPARIIGVDHLTDTALLRLEGAPATKPLPLGRSSDLSVGEMVMALGNPLGLSHTVTQGLVSATERVVPGEGAPLVDFIQTDSAINPGSSGGPLINLYGEVVGINTAIVSSAQLIGFAVPIDTVKSVIPLLIVGEDRRGWLGISIAHEDGAMRTRLIEESLVPGVVVDTVETGSPAAAAGIEPGDRIVGLNGSPVPDVLSLQRLMVGMLVGEKVQFIVRRPGGIYSIDATLGPHPAAR